MLSRFWKKLSFCETRVVSRFYFNTFFETQHMVNLGQKTAVFGPWNQVTKKKYHQDRSNVSLKPLWFHKNWLKRILKPLWFHENWLFSKTATLSTLIFQISTLWNSKGFPLEVEDTLICAKGNKNLLFLLKKSQKCTLFMLLNNFFFLIKP